MICRKQVKQNNIIAYNKIQTCVRTVDQETIWRDTMEDDNPTVEREIRQGGLSPQNVDPRMFHDIQVILARLVGKAHQLIGNATTNLAECWMHIRTNVDGGRVINPSQSGSGTTGVWVLVYAKTLVQHGDQKSGQRLPMLLTKSLLT